MAFALLNKRGQFPTYIATGVKLVYRYVKNMIRKYTSSDLEALRKITIICFERVSIDKNIEDGYGLIGAIGWKTRKDKHIDADVGINPDGIFVVERSSITN